MTKSARVAAHTADTDCESNEHHSLSGDGEGEELMLEKVNAESPGEAADVSVHRDAAHDDVQEGAALSVDEALDSPSPATRSRNRRLAAYLVAPLLMMCMAVVAGYLRFYDGSAKSAQAAAVSSVAAASESTVALLSYRPDSAAATLNAARDRLTGSFRDAYTSLINDVVIPGATEKRISATATVPAASSVSASDDHAVVLLFVDQSVIVGDGAPSATASAVQVTLERVESRWLISGFDPK